jgi:hypothetical protein
MNTAFHPQYITDETGKRVSVVLSIEEFQAMAERLDDLEDLADARESIRQLHQGNEETIPWEAVKAEHGL